jgi:MFS family permease
MLRRAGRERSQPDSAQRDALGRPSLRQALGALEAPMYRRWFFSQILSASGTMTQAVAIAWLVLKLTGSAVDLGLMSSCIFGPMLLLGPWAGVVVDRVDQRKLLIATQAAFIGLAVVLAVLVETGAVRLWMLFAIAVLNGVVGAPDQTARQSYVVELIDRDRLASAISLYEVVVNASRAIGPAVGGALLATVGVSACIIVNAASYLPPLIVLLGFQSTRVASAKRDRASRKGELRAGVRYVLHHGTIRASILMAAASGMLFGLTTLPLMATRVFHVGGGGYGLMYSMFGVGAVGGALVAGAGRGRPTGRSVRVLCVLTALAVVAAATASGIAVELAALTVAGCLSIWFIARTNTVVQLETDPAMRGRVMGIWTMALPGTAPLSAPFVGFVAQTLGARAGFAVAAVALLAAAAFGWRALGRRSHDPALDAAATADAGQVGVAVPS